MINHVFISFSAVQIYDLSYIHLQWKVRLFVWSVFAAPSSTITRYYSTNCNTIQIWSWCSRYLSSVGNRYPAVYVASYVGRKSEVRKYRQRDIKILGCFVINLLNNTQLLDEVEHDIMNYQNRAQADHSMCSWFNIENVWELWIKLWKLHI